MYIGKNFFFFFKCEIFERKYDNLRSILKLGESDWGLREREERKRIHSNSQGMGRDLEVGPVGVRIVGLTLGVIYGLLPRLV